MKNVIIIASSPRKNGNSNALVKAFEKGAKEAGNSVETVYLAGKKIEFCCGCMSCNHTLRCVIRDDVKEILEKMQGADVVVFATPIYYYSVSGQLKTFFDRTSPLFAAEYQFRDIYLLATAADDGEETVKGTEEAVQGWIECYPKTRLVKTIFAGGVDAVGDITGHKALIEAYDAGQNIV